MIRIHTTELPYGVESVHVEHGGQSIELVRGVQGGGGASSSPLVPAEIDRAEPDRKAG